MDFTDKYIAKTYPNVMVNDPFTNGNPILKKSHEVRDIKNSLNNPSYNGGYPGYSCIYDGDGRKSNLMVSLESGCSEVSSNNNLDVYPHSLYTVNGGSTSFILSGDGFEQHKAFLYKKENSKYSFKNSNLFIEDTYAKFGHTIWPYRAADENDVLSLSGASDNNRIVFNKTMSNMFYGRFERYTPINRLYSETYGCGNDGATVHYKIDFRDFTNDPSNAKTVILGFSSYVTVSHTGKGVNTYIQFPGWLNRKQITNQANGVFNVQNFMYYIPYTPEFTIFEIWSEKNGGHGWSWTGDKYNQYYDSQTITVKIYGIIHKNQY